MNIPRCLSPVLIFSLAVSILSPAQQLFSPSRLELPLIQYPIVHATGDFDGNGITDIVACNGDGQLFMALRLASDTYETHEIYSWGVISGDFRIYAADVNGDQKLDIIACYLRAKKIYSFIGNGNGGFSDTVVTDLSSILVLNSNVAVGEADFNMDGIADLALASISGMQTTLFLFTGDGAGGFTMIKTITCPFMCGIAHAIGDFNEDGSLDLGITNITGGQDSVFMFFGDGQWNFTPGPAIPLGTGSYSFDIHVGDVNNDHHLDIISSSSDGVITVLPGDGTGNFSQFQETFPGESVRYFALADFNEDNILDLVIVGYDHGIGIMNGVGNGTFSAPRWYNHTIVYGTISASDLNNDGHEDVVTVSPYGISLFYGSGDGSLQIAPEYHAGLRSCSSATMHRSTIAAADFNGDGFIDLAVANPCGNEVSILFGTGTGEFGTSPTILQIPGRPFAIAAADMNGNGTTDIVVSDDLAGVIYTFLGDGHGGFGAPVIYNLGETPSDFVIHDFNKDNHADVAVLSRTSHSVFILHGDGSGSFSDSQKVGLTDSATAITCDDFNEDGNPDLAVGLYWSGGLSYHSFVLLLGDAQGRFAVGGYFGSTVILPSTIVSSDFNEDGHKDIALYGMAGEVYLGDGKGGMTQAPPFPDISGFFLASSFVAADLNADSHIDLVLGTPLIEGVVTVLLGRGNGAFALSSYNYGLNGLIGAVCAADFNSDGAIDLAVAHPDTSIVSILRGMNKFDHDVGILSIESPQRSEQLGASITPQVKIGNFGSMSETFQVTCVVDTSYQDQKDVTLNPGDQTLVSFKQWVPMRPGVYGLTFKVVLPVDQNAGNNVMTRSVTVIGTDLTVDAIMPDEGGNTGWVTAIIHGAHFQSGAVAKLKRQGMNDIVADSAAFEATKVLSPDTMRAVFNLRNAAEGYWDLEVKNPGGSTVLISNAFKVAKGKQQLWMDIAGSSVIVFRQPAMYLLLVGNSGNVNINYIVPILTVPDVVDLDSITSENEHRVLLYGDSLRAHNKKPGRIPFFIRNLAPGERKTFALYIRGNTVTPPSRKTGGAVPTAITELPAFSWSGLILSGVECLAKNVVKNEVTPDATEQDWLDGFVDALIGFGEGLVGEIIKRGTEIAFPWTIPFIEAYELADAAMTAAEDVGQFLDGGEASKKFRIAASRDPNQKIGPSGYGDGGYIVGDRPLSYQIHFENVDTATAPAQNIYVTDTLDADLNWSTMVVGQTSHPPTKVTVDSLQGIITWTFEGINLPPNKHPPEGEGWVTYTIRPKETLPSSTQITNRATIVFDLNDPILTQTVLNTIDNSAPSSAVQALDPEQHQVAFTLNWAGSDNESGVCWYQVFVAENDGGYQLWTQTPKTSGIFIGKNGRSYKFYTIAVDNVGNTEAAPLSPDMTTVIKADEDIGFSPNPFVPSRGHRVITLFGGGLAYAEVKIFDKAGRLVRTLHESSGSSTLDWDATNDNGEKLASGVYIWVLSGPAGTSKGKFAIIR